MGVEYEWDIETISDDGCEDVIDHDFMGTTLSAARRLEQHERLVLVRDVGSIDTGVMDRAWAYVSGEGLPEEFDNGCKVPVRFHKQLARYLGRVA